MLRVNLNSKGQALDGDTTTTGATCIASATSYLSNDRAVLREGDSTTPCPECGEAGTIVEGLSFIVSEGLPVVVDGALVNCGCPSGNNRVVAPLADAAPVGRVAPASIAAAVTASANPYQARSASPSPVKSNFSSGVSASPATLEPGFYIVPRSMSGPQVLAQLLTQDSTLPIARLQRLNPRFEQGFKAGEIFVIGDPDNHHACTREEAKMMQAATRAREALAKLSVEEANFMMEHIGEIAGVLNGASTSMGVGKDMLDKGLGQVKDTLKGIEALHQREFTLHGHLKSPEFFASRSALYQRLDAQLRSAFLGKYLNLGGHESLRKSLGISTKSLVHHWSKAGAPGEIPGYATHLDEVAKMAKYLKYGGHVAVGVGAASSYLKVQEVCRAGETEECRRVRFTEAGSFAGGLTGGFYGAKAGGLAATFTCGTAGAVTAGLGSAVCAIVLVGAGSLIGGAGGTTGGEWLGDTLYEWRSK